MSPTRKENYKNDVILYLTHCTTRRIATKRRTHTVQTQLETQTIQRAVHVKTESATCAAANLKSPDRARHVQLPREEKRHCHQ